MKYRERHVLVRENVGFCVFQIYGFSWVLFSNDFARFVREAHVILVPHLIGYNFSELTVSVVKKFFNQYN